MTHLPCFMCRTRPARPLAAARGRVIYLDGQNVVLFCSVRCAANYALVYSRLHIEDGYHFCAATQEWEPIAQHECENDECRQDIFGVIKSED